MPPWNNDTGYCDAMKGLSWTSDSVFCLSGASTFWQTCLFIGLAFWGFFTVLQLFSAFDIQHAHGQALGRTVTHLVRQVILLLLACASFFLLMLVHQLVYLICNSLVGKELPPWRVDDLWLGDGGQNVLLALRIQLDAPYANNPLLNICNIFSGGNCGFGQPQVGGNTFFQIAQGVGFLANMMLQSTGAIRFVIMLVLLGAAPLAIITAGFPHLRERVFRLWLTKWLELEGLAIVAALGLAAFQAVLCTGPGGCAQFTQVQIKIGDHSIPVTPGKPLLIPDKDQPIWPHDINGFKEALVLPAGMITLQIPEDVTTLTTVDLGQSKITKDPYFRVTTPRGWTFTAPIPVTAAGQLFQDIEKKAGDVLFIGIPLKHLVDTTLRTFQFELTIGGDIITATLGVLGTLQIQAPDPTKVLPESGYNQQQFVFLLLGFAVIICGLQIGYVWNLIGNFLNFGTDMYRAEYNRDMATIKAIANVVGMAGDLAGKVLSIVGIATGQPEIAAAGQIISSVSDTPDKLMSAIPQANGYGGGTASSLPPPSGNSGLLSAVSTLSGDGSGGGGTGGDGPAPVAGYLPAPVGNGSTGSPTASQAPANQSRANGSLGDYPTGGQTNYGPSVPTPWNAYGGTFTPPPPTRVVDQWPPSQTGIPSGNEP
jgi:hypothetical protein